MSNKNDQILESAEELAREASTWADLSNALYDPIDGLITKAYPTREERAAFVKTPQYKAIRELVSAAMDRTGLIKGATPQKSGKFVVRLPKTLHAALEQEAKNEGVSLNQLVVAKLSISMSQLASGSSETVCEPDQRSSK